MKFKKFITKVAATAFAVALAGGTAIPTHAEGKTYTPVSGGTAVFEKYLTMNKNANVPNVTFDFEIAAGQKLDSDGSTTLKVFAGDDASAVSGTPTISSANFKQGDTTYDSIQTQPESVTVQKSDDGTTTNQDKLTLAEGKKYARADVTVDFTGVSFKEPGDFRWLITEKEGNLNGITNDSDDTRVMDVYVQDDGTGKLAVTGYVLQNAEANGTVLRDGTGVTEKSKGYTNDYTTHDLTISKKVEGKQASRDEYFKFTVKISGATAGTVYDVDLTNADATTKTNGINTEAHTNPATLTVGEDGTVTQDYWLQNGQSIKIQGLADKTAYSVNEDAATLNAESYDPSATITGDTETKLGEGEVSMDDTTYTVADDAITADTTVAYTNTKDGTIPTGRIAKVGPAVAGVAVFGVAIAIVIIASKKKKKAE